MKKILIIIGYYLPGHKAGGQVRSIENLVEALGDEYDFHILTSDRDLGEDKPYEGIKINAWNLVGKAKVYYLPPKKNACKIIMEICKDIPVIYNCGCFDKYTRMALFLKWRGKVAGRVIVASMGLFSEGAFQIKNTKKKWYVGLTKGIGLYKNILWSATSEDEVLDIKRIIGQDAKCMIAQDLPRIVENREIEKNKENGKLKVIFLSRISRKKNISFAIDILGDVKKEIEFTIAGPLEDEMYWNECKKKLNNLNSNITWRYIGMIDSNEIIQVLEEQHVFLFPTFGENYGHVIQEALSAGCQVIVSDQTPWKDLKEKGVGYVIPLKDKKRYVHALELYVEYSSEQMQQASERAVVYAIEKSSIRELSKSFREMFDNGVIDEDTIFN